MTTIKNKSTINSHKNHQHHIDLHPQNSPYSIAPLLHPQKHIDHH